MKSFLLAVLSVLTTCTTINAQQGNIVGKIQMGDSITALSGVSVYLDNNHRGTSTNGNGNYAINNVTAGNYTLIVSAVGYITIKKEITVQSGETLRADFLLIEAISTLPEVTVITGGNTGIKDIPGSVYYVSPKEIQKFGYTDINRTLRTVPGVNIQEEEGYGLRPNIGLRGTGAERSSKITIMEDGVLMAPAPYAAPAAYYFPTIGRMQAVEILKGSSQIKYGPYTTGGAINLISTQIPNEFSGRINLLGGSYQGRNLHAYIGNAHKHFAYMVETFQFSSDGFKQLDGGGNTGFDKKDFLAKFRINTSDSAKVYQSLTFKIGQAIETSNQTYLGLTQSDFDANPFRLYSGSQKDQMNTKQSQFSVTHIAKFSKSFDITTTAYYSEFKRNWYKLDAVKDSLGNKVKIANLLDNPTGFNDAYAIITGTSSLRSDALLVKANNRSYFAKGVQTVLSFNFNTGNLLHDIDLGIRIHQDQIDQFQWVDNYAMNNGVMMLTAAGTPGTESNRIETADALATYLQYKLRYKKFTFTPGVRFEHIQIARDDYGNADPNRTGAQLAHRSNTVDVIIPGMGLDYQFSKHLSSFIGIHKGFAPPGSLEETLPEESINYELGVRYAKNSLSGQAVLFFNDYSNLLGSDLAAAGGGGTNDLYNGGEVQSKGLEFQISYDLLSVSKNSSFSLPLSIAYTYTDAKFLTDFDSEFEGWGIVSSGDEIPYLAKNQFSVMLGIEHNKFSINLSGRYSDAMRTAPGQGEIPSNEKTDAYFVLDAGASYRLHKNIVLFANATNITDQVYVVARRPSGLRPGMSRVFNIGLKANF